MSHKLEWDMFLWLEQKEWNGWVHENISSNSSKIHVHKKFQQANFKNSEKFHYLFFKVIIKKIIKQL